MGKEVKFDVSGYRIANHPNRPLPPDLTISPKPIRKRTMLVACVIATVLVVSLGILFLVAYSQGIFEMVCPQCQSKGFIVKITRMDLIGESVMIRKDPYWRINATFYNEGDENTSEPVYAYIAYEGEKFDEKTASCYFPSCAYTTVTLDLHASSANTTATYDMNVPAEKRVVICPECKGKGYVSNWDAVKLVVIATLVVIIIFLLLPFSNIRSRS